MIEGRQPKSAAVLGRLAKAAGEAHAHLEPMAEAAESRGATPQVGDVWSLAHDSAAADAVVDPGVCEWAVLATEPAGGLLLVPADTAILTGSADVAAAGGRRLRCRLARRLAPSALAGGRRTAVLDERTLDRARSLVREDAKAAEAATLMALETDRDPEYRDLIRQLSRAGEAWAQHHALEHHALENHAFEDRHQRPRAIRADDLRRRGRPLMAEPVEGRRRRRWLLPSSAAAALLLTLGAAVIAIQWRTIDSLQRESERLIADPRVVWLEPAGERGRAQVEMAADQAPYVVLVMRPEPLGALAESYRLTIFAEASAAVPLWSGERSPGTLPELFVLVPSKLLAPGSYRLELFARSDGEEVASGRFHLVVKAGQPVDG